MKKRLEVLFHILFWFLTTWIIYLTFGTSAFEVQNIDGVVSTKVTRNISELWHFLLGGLFKATIVYLNLLFLFPQFERTKNTIGLVIKLAAATIIALAIETITVSYIMLGMDGITIIETPRIPVNLTLYIFYLGLSFAYCFSRSWIKNEQQKTVLIEEKLGTELNFLKAQINPHFLFNTLNNLYSLANKANSPELSEGISKLSNLMRYMLYESNNEKVPLNSEIEYIQSFIEIQKLRLAEEDDFIIHFNIEGDTNHIFIAPMLLIPFVENAFKHGINFKDSSIIKIELKLHENELIFSVFNSNYKVEHSLEKGRSGIGLENMRRRLELLYPNSHSLEIKEEDEVHGAILKLNLS